MSPPDNRIQSTGNSPARVWLWFFPAPDANDHVVDARQGTWRREPMTHAPVIRDIRVRAVKVPFVRPPISASGALPDAALVLIDILTDAGITGRAYVFTF